MSGKIQIPTDTMEQEFSAYHRRGYQKGLAENAAHITELEAQLAEQKKDAERYRWLRNEHGIDLPVAHVSWKINQNRNSTVWVNTSDASALDNAIDAAIAEGKHDR